MVLSCAIGLLFCLLVFLRSDVVFDLSSTKITWGGLLVIPHASFFCSRTSGNHISVLHDEGRQVQLPPFIVQYGEGRSASTLMHEILCAASFLVWNATTASSSPGEDLPSSRRSSSGEDHPRGPPTSRRSSPPDCFYSFFPESEIFSLPTTRTNVLKTHRSPAEWTPSERLKELLKNHELWAFESTRTTSSWSANTVLSRHVSAVQHLHSFESFRKYIQDSYGPYFDFSETQITAIARYIGRWSLLRQCCGAQMSVGWREHLWEVWGGAGETKTSPPVVASTGGTSGSSSTNKEEIVQRCVSEDINNVQWQLLKGDPVFSLFRKGRRSQRDDAATFGKTRYVNCSRANQWIGQHRAKFNAYFPDSVRELYPPSPGG